MNNIIVPNNDIIIYDIKIRPDRTFGPEKDRPGYLPYLVLFKDRSYCWIGKNLDYLTDFAKKKKNE
jgi:hypothetical protein